MRGLRIGQGIANREMKMPEAPGMDADQEMEILRRVSRSFALTIPQLPPPLRRTVANAYLICRITDTIEDDESLPLERKRFFFEEFNRVLEGRASAENFAGVLYPLLAGGTLLDERELVRRTPSLIRATLALEERKKAAIQRCARVMSRGMLSFQERKSPDGLKDVTDFESYCYHVAGVVGEMLTEFFCEYSGKIAQRRERLMAFAVSFGKGLQMTNILKDLWEDRRRGSCWLPQDVFREAGFDLRGLARGTTAAFGKGLAVLIGLARAHLEDALAYTLIIPRRETGIRKFCLWAIGMALLTLRKIYRNRAYQSGEEVKISRKSLQAVIWGTGAALRSNLLLRALFHLTARGLPRCGILPQGGGCESPSLAARSGGNG